VLFDPDWNPAVDKQVRHFIKVFIICLSPFLGCGTLLARWSEETVFYLQILGDRNR